MSLNLPEGGTKEHSIKTPNQFSHSRSSRTAAATCASLLASAMLVLALPASAQAPYSPNLVDGGNKWFIDAYNDTDPDHVALATPGICFEYAGVVGTHQQYTWYSDTFLGWQGTASQEGDQVFMHGVYANGQGRDAIQVRIIIDAPRHGSVGHWQEWRDNGAYGKTVGFANARMIRNGNCTMTASQALGGGWTFPFPFPIPTTSDNPMTFK
jgi:hypothetical protein